MKKWHLIMVVVVTAIFVAIVGPVAYTKYRHFVDRVKLTELLVRSTNLLEQGYRPVEDLDDIDGASFCTSIVFVGHIYGANTLPGADGVGYPDLHKPLRTLKEVLNRSRTGRVIFGGDNVFRPGDTDEWLGNLKEEIPDSRFLLGNHDDYWTYWRSNQQVFKDIYQSRYWKEDIDGVRLVYLHTIDESGLHRLDAEQIEFLTGVLHQNEDYRYALVFMHSALFDRFGIISNELYTAEALDSWQSDVIPILKQGRVLAVFAGDGGQDSDGGMLKQSGIPMFVSGWPLQRSDILPEWLNVRLGHQSIGVVRFKTLRDDLYYKQRLFWRDEAGSDVCRSNARQN